MPNVRRAFQGFFLLVLSIGFGLTACGDGDEVERAEPAELNAPSELEATASDGAVSLAWGPVNRAASYIVLRSSNSGGPYAPIGQAQDSRYTDDGLRNGTTYYYVVRATNSRATSANSVEVSATPSAQPVQRAPAPPGRLEVVAGDGRVTLSWSGVSGADRYRVFVARQTGGPYNRIAEVPGTAYVHGGLENGQTYFYRITALNEAGSSGFSNETAVTPIQGEPPAPPPAPSGLSALAGNGRVTVSWEPAPGALVYELYSTSQSGGPYTRIVTLENTQFTHDGLTNETTYYYIAMAINETGESPESEEVSATPREVADDEPDGDAPASPENLAAEWTGDAVHLEWQTVASATSYNILRSLDCTDDYALIDTVSESPFMDESALNDKLYCYRVQAANEFGTSNPSQPASLNTTD